MSIQAKLLNFITKVSLRFQKDIRDPLLLRKKLYKDMKALQKVPNNVVTEPVTIDGLQAEWVAIDDLNKDTIILYVHGGGFFMDSIDVYRGFAAQVANAANGKTLLINYRLGPENQHPAALEDCVKAYQFLLNNLIPNK